MKSQIKPKSPKKAVKTMAATKSATKSAAPIVPMHKHRHQGPGKTFHKDGHWIENPRKNSILTCSCGNKYLKTRHGQTKCLKCISLGK
jgi:hypothetical protein